MSSGATQLSEGNASFSRTCCVTSGQDPALSGLSVLICKTGLNQRLSKGPSGSKSLRLPSSFILPKLPPICPYP